MVPQAQETGMTARLFSVGLPVLVSVLFMMHPSFTAAQTLKEAVQTVIDSHPDVRSVSHNRLARDQEVRQAKSGYFPTLEFVAGAGIDDVNEPFDDQLSPQEYRISLRQNLFAGLSTKNEVKRQRARVRSEAYIVKSTSENLALRTTRAYIDVLRYQALLELARKNLELHETIGKQIELRSKSGVGRKADMDQVLSRIKLAEANVGVARQNLADAKTTYQALIGELPSKLERPEVPQDLLPDRLDEALQIALQHHPTLRSAKADLDARKAQADVAKSRFMPILDIEVDQVWEDETNYSYSRREDLRAMVRFRYNLFNGWKDRARRAETVELINEAREIRNHTRRQVIESLNLSWMAYRSIVDRLPLLKQRVEFATITARSYRRQWKIGKRTLLDVLDSEAERIDAMMQYIDTDFTGLYAKYRVLNGMGGLIHGLKVQYPAEAEIPGQDSAGDEAPRRPSAS